MIKSKTKNMTTNFYKTRESEELNELVSLTTNKVLMKSKDKSKILEIKFKNELNKFIKKTKKNKFVFELIESKKLIGCRIVETKKEIRFEALYPPNHYVVCDERLFISCENKLPKAFLNY